MLTDFLQDQAALYVSGAMCASDREQFELLLEFHLELREFVAGFADVGAAVLLAGQGPRRATPPVDLKARILALVKGRLQRVTPEGMVMCGPEGFVEWINPAFTAMCGYSLDELRGKKLGPILQGAETDQETAERMRRAVHERVPCRETIVNYHKNGTPYWVEIAITPIVDDSGEPVYFVARERELAAHIAA